MSTSDQWRYLSHPGELIIPDQVHVWQASLEVGAQETENLMGTLSADELERAGRFRFEPDKKRFIAARGILRNILGRYRNTDPGKIRFGYTPAGKPELVSGSGALHFNLSHSGAFALYAIALHRAVGIDIELIRYDMEVEEIARKFFSENEIGALRQAPESRLHDVFFQYWTRKEAFVKAIGKGIVFPMHEVDVSLANGTDLSPVAWPGDQKENTGWYVQDLFPAANYRAAVAVEGKPCEVICLRYSI